MTQPPLSRQIQQLESELGVHLIDRTTRSVTLTPAGVAFLPDARRILQLAEGAALNVKRVPAGDLGTVVIGFTAASAHAAMPRLLDAAREHLPDVKLDLREMVTAAQIEGLMTGELDLGMCRPPLKRPGLVSRPLLHEQLIAAMPVGHPLGDIGRQLTLNDLDGQDMIMYSPVQARYFNELLISTFTIAGATPRYVQYVTQVHTMLVLVAPASASRWSRRQRRRCIPRACGSARSARSGSGPSSSTRPGAATAPTRRCCACCATCSRRANGPPTTWSRTWWADRVEIDEIVAVTGGSRHLRRIRCLEAADLLLEQFGQPQRRAVLEHRSDQLYSHR